jgi:exosortase/archaeosortase family protein
MRYEYSLLIRVILCFIPIAFFDAVLIPLTTYVSYALLWPAGAVMAGGLISVSGFAFTIVEACVASFAFYLMWILMLLTKDLSLSKRVGLFLSGAGLLFIVNIVRIIILVSVGIHFGVETFDSLHFLIYYIFSGVMVAVIWISLVSAFRIKSTPIVDDLKTLWKLVRN